MEGNGIEVIRNYSTDELEVFISCIESTSNAMIYIISGTGETIEQTKLLIGKNIIPLKKYLYKNFNIRISNNNNVVLYAL